MMEYFLPPNGDVRNPTILRIWATGKDRWVVTVSEPDAAEPISLWLLNSTDGIKNIHPGRSLTTEER